MGLQLHTKILRNENRQENMLSILRQNEPQQNKFITNLSCIIYQYILHLQNTDLTLWFRVQFIGKSGTSHKGDWWTQLQHWSSEKELHFKATCLTF